MGKSRLKPGTRTPDPVRGTSRSPPPRPAPVLGTPGSAVLGLPVVAGAPLLITALAVLALISVPSVPVLPGSPCRGAVLQRSEVQRQARIPAERSSVMSCRWQWGAGASGWWTGPSTSRTGTHCRSRATVWADLRHWYSRQCSPSPHSAVCSPVVSKGTL